MELGSTKGGEFTEQASTTSLSFGVTQDAVPEGTLSDNRAVIGPQTLDVPLADSGQRVLEVLAQLLEWGDGLMPTELLSRVGNSPLLLDPHLHDDTGSLHRIRVIIDQGV